MGNTHAVGNLSDIVVMETVKEIGIELIIAAIPFLFAIIYSLFWIMPAGGRPLKGWCAVIAFLVLCLVVSHGIAPRYDLSAWDFCLVVRSHIKLFRIHSNWFVDENMQPYNRYSARHKIDPSGTNAFVTLVITIYSLAVYALRLLFGPYLEIFSKRPATRGRTTKKKRRRRAKQTTSPSDFRQNNSIYSGLSKLLLLQEKSTLFKSRSLIVKSTQPRSNCNVSSHVEQKLGISYAIIGATEYAHQDDLHGLGFEFDILSNDLYEAQQTIARRDVTIQQGSESSINLTSQHQDVDPREILRATSHAVMAFSEPKQYVVKKGQMLAQVYRQILLTSSSGTLVNGIPIANDIPAAKISIVGVNLHDNEKAKMAETLAVNKKNLLYEDELNGCLTMDGRKLRNLLHRRPTYKYAHCGVNLRDDCCHSFRLTRAISQSMEAQAYSKIRRIGQEEGRVIITLMAKVTWDKDKYQKLKQKAFPNLYALSKETEDLSWDLTEE
ncbi:uncharacterized protein PAC_01824 [Phialocephala subalpina]|uniref:Uncharacterized protein n=1 Tax=Phialocephala subalpina TaxID=576137 RepID=A0A1L7WGS3_9HELO|nr:uncharacterized protein PAC_01824 [Phialocephala subalpina]